MPKQVDKKPSQKPYVALKDHKKILSLMYDLWWFIENVPFDDPDRTDRFFALRERVWEAPRLDDLPESSENDLTKKLGEVKNLLTNLHNHSADWADDDFLKEIDFIGQKVAEAVSEVVAERCLRDEKA